MSATQVAIRFAPLAIPAAIAWHLWCYRTLKGGRWMLAGDALSFAAAGACFTQAMELGCAGLSPLQAGREAAAAGYLAAAVAGACWPLLFHRRTAAPRGGLTAVVGQELPDLCLVAPDGTRVAVRDVLGPRGALLVLYRGHG